MSHTAKWRVHIAYLLVTFLLWPATAMAAKAAFGESLGTTVAGVPLLAWITVFVLSTVFGLGALLNRLRKETPERLKLFVCSQMVSSWLAGGLAFFIGEATEWSDLTKILFISVASYSGAVFIDRVSDMWLNKLPGVPDASKADQKAQ